jgi:MoaA/NifB/PqqE/SkfB family radical SAM enzyme
MSEAQEDGTSRMSHNTGGKPALTESICCYSNNSYRKIVWQITDNCPLGCQYCFTPSKGRGDLTVKQAISLVALIRETYASKDLMLFAGREPLLYKGIEEVVKASTEAGFYCSMSTSGELLSSKRIELLTACGLRKINVTINSSDSGLHKLSRPMGNLENVVANIGHALSAGLVTKVNITVTLKTVATLGKTLLYLGELGVRKISIGLLHTYDGKGGRDLLWQYEKTKEFKDLLMGFTHYSDAELKIVIPPSTHDCFAHRDCPAKNGLIAILPDGTIAGCNIYPDLAKGAVNRG